MRSQQNWRQFRFNPARLLAVAVVGLFLRSPGDLEAEQTSTTVQVRIRDMAQGAVPNARVWLFPSPGRARATGDDGTVTFAVKPGDYDLLVLCAGFRDVAKRFKVLEGEPGVVDVALHLAGCSQCVTIEPWDPGVVFSFSSSATRGLALKAADLRLLQRRTVVVDSPDGPVKEIHTGISLAEVLVKLLKEGGHDARPSRSTPAYVVVSGNTNSVVLPLARLVDEASGDEIVICNNAGGTTLPNNYLKAFRTKNGRIVEFVDGIIRIRLVSPE